MKRARTGDRKREREGGREGERERERERERGTGTWKTSRVDRPGGVRTVVSRLSNTTTEPSCSDDRYVANTDKKSGLEQTCRHTGRARERDEKGTGGAHMWGHIQA
jgi:hypothetical protein